MEEEILDFVLVPVGLLLLAAYHMWLLRQIIRHPATTVIGINAFNRRLWVRAMMQDTTKNGILAVQTLRNNIMASTVLALTTITLSSIMAVWMSGGGGVGGGHCPVGLVYGDNSKLGFSIKTFSILVCFLSAFLLNVQSIRYYSHASMLINVPKRKRGSNPENVEEEEESGYVCRIVNKGGYFWSLGLHAVYFSFPLFLWIFGPIPMFLSCVVLVFLLYFLDMGSDFRSVLSSKKTGEEHWYAQAEEEAV